MKKSSIISTKYASNMMETWKVYLLLVHHPDDVFEIGVTQYPIIGLAADFYDENDDLVMPDEIGGEKVIGVEGDYVIGGDLILDSSQYSTLRFWEINEDDINDWLASEGWDVENFRKIETAVKQLKKS
jgi:hypothetical protein